MTYDLACARMWPHSRPRRGKQSPGRAQDGERRQWENLLGSADRRREEHCCSGQRQTRIYDVRKIEPRILYLYLVMERISMPKQYNSKIIVLLPHLCSTTFQSTILPSSATVFTAYGPLPSQIYRACKSCIR